MKDDKLFISLLVSFLALIAILAIYGGTVGVGNESEMMPYDFLNFTMDVPKGTFLDESIDDNISTFKDVDGDFIISYIASDGIYQEMVDFYNYSSNSSVEVEDNFTIVHVVNSNIIDSSYSEMVLVGDGNQIVIIQGNDVDLLKNMANTIKFNI